MTYRDTALALARRSPADYLGITLSGDDWIMIEFAGPEALGTWYSSEAGKTSSYDYVVMIDKTRIEPVAAESILRRRSDDAAFAGKFAAIGFLGIGLASGFILFAKQLPRARRRRTAFS